MNGPWCAPSPAEDPPLSTESSGGTVSPPREPTDDDVPALLSPGGPIGCHAPVDECPPPLSGLAAWFHGTYPKPTAKLEDPWCECDKVPNRPGSMTNRHVHWTCWQCGTEVICVSVYGYTCDNCDVAQNAMSDAKPDPMFDYDAAALWLNP